MQLRVRAHAQLSDRDQLQRLEPRPREVDRRSGGSRTGAQGRPCRQSPSSSRMPCAKVSVYVPAALRFTATSSEPVVIWPASRAASRSVIWSFPPTTWYFSLDCAEDPKLALAAVAEQVEQVQRALLGRLGAVLDVVGDVEELPDSRADPARERSRRSSRRSTCCRARCPRCGRGLERRRIARGREVGVDLLPRGLDVAGDLGEAVRGSRRSSRARSVPFCSAWSRLSSFRPSSVRAAGSRCGPGRSARRRARRSDRPRTRRAASSSVRRCGQMPRGSRRCSPRCAACRRR